MKYVLGNVESNNAFASKKCILYMQDNHKMSSHSLGFLSFSSILKQFSQCIRAYIVLWSSTAVPKSFGHPTRDQGITDLSVLTFL